MYLLLQPAVVVSQVVSVYERIIWGDNAWRDHLCNMRTPPTSTVDLGVNVVASLHLACPLLLSLSFCFRYISVQQHYNGAKAYKTSHDLALNIRMALVAASPSCCSFTRLPPNLGIINEPTNHALPTIFISVLEAGIRTNEGIGTPPRYDVTDDNAGATALPVSKTVRT